MVRLGEIQTLKVIRKVSIGAYLNEADAPPEEAVLLPNNQLSKDVNVGDDLEVFVYKDSEDRLIATRKKPFIRLSGIAVLKVIETTPVGAFLDWGLEKDLLLPFKEQTTAVQAGEKYPVKLYIDKSERLCASMYLADVLRKDSPYKENQRVRGTVYSISEEFGAYVAVDNLFDGIIPPKELYGTFRCGDEVTVRVKKIRQNGRLELSLRENIVKQMDADSLVILEKLEQRGGFLGLHDGSQPDQIKAELNMSKAAFKRAIGRLYKENKIDIGEGGISKKS